jgi:hypothetical protein
MSVKATSTEMVRHDEGGQAFACGQQLGAGALVGGVGSAGFKRNPH